MTQKLNTDKAYNDTVDRRPAGNSGLAKVAVQFSADTFVVNRSLVLASTFVVKIATFAKPQTVVCHAEKPTAQTAHLVFADTKANARKTKRAVFCQRSKD
ncbi:MAG: hypothetical protein U0W65_09375 [Bacteroidia bacterium]